MMNSFGAVWQARDHKHEKCVFSYILLEGEPEPSLLAKPFAIT
jgi:hypothetical protein